MTTPPLTRLQVACPLQPCPTGWTIDVLVPTTDPDALQAQAGRCVADHIAVVHAAAVPSVTVDVPPPDPNAAA